MTGKTDGRRARGRQRLEYLDSLCASWKDNVSPTQLIRASGVLWHPMWPTSSTIARIITTELICMLIINNVR